MRRFFRFEKMMTPVLVEVFFWLLTCVSILVGVAFIVRWGLEFVTYGYGAEFILLGCLLCIVGPVIARIWAELVIVVFKIHETLVEIRDSNYEQETF